MGISRSGRQRSAGRDRYSNVNRSGPNLELNPGDVVLGNWLVRGVFRSNLERVFYICDMILLAWPGD